jgi:hypothetical protein
MLAGCGAKGPPLPPLGHRPEPVAGLKVRQQGDALLLEGKLPDLYTDGAELKATPEITITRVLPGGKPQVLRRVPAGEVGAAPGERMQLRLSMEEVFGDITAERVSLQLVLKAAEGRPSRPGRPVDVVRGSPPPPPAGLVAENREDGILLTWQAGADEGSELEYQIYRRQEPSQPWDGPLSGESIAETSYLDREVQLGSYQYQVRSRLVDAEPVRESEAGQAVTVLREDRFAPGVPAAVRAVSAPGGIRVFWFPPESADLGGFRLYRTADGMQHLRTELPADATFFVDREVRPGIGYRYSVSAVDRAEPPNESAPSASTEEVAIDEGAP